MIIFGFSVDFFGIVVSFVLLYDCVTINYLILEVFTIMDWFKLTSIKKKLLAAYLPLIIVSGIAISIAAYSVFTIEMERASNQYAEQTAEMINRHLNTYLDELERLSLFPYFHSNVMDILRQREEVISTDEQYRQYKLFDDMFNNIMLNPREDLLNVFLYRADGKRYFNTRVNVVLNMHYEWKNSSWYDETLRANGSVVFTPNSGKDGRFDVLPYDAFSISRLVKTDSGRILGAILIDANFQGVEGILRDVGLSGNANVVLKDATGHIMYSQNSRYLKELEDALPNAKRVQAGDEMLFVGSSVSETTGWSTSVLIPSGQISNSFLSIRTIILWMLVLFGMLAIIVTYWFSAGITRPIVKMQRMVRMVEAGNYNTRIDVHGNDEISSLGLAFNKMSGEIKALIHEVYEHDLHQKEAELNNLKMQIRPHFLYNTLEAIRSLAEIHNNQDIVEMTTSLGSILRYSIKTHEKLVLLDKEIEYIQQYINIHRIMTGDSIRVEMNIEPSVLRFYSIPLLFQPIIENAYQHGLYGKRRDGLLRIEGQQVGDELHFAVYDNGKGIDSTSLERLNRVLESPRSNEAASIGLGLSNVNQRIRIVFGLHYGLSVDSKPGSGTVVRIRIPVLQHPGDLNQ